MRHGLFGSILSGYLLVSVLGSACDTESDTLAGKTADEAPRDTAPPGSRTIFVTSTVQGGALGGLAGADATCQALGSAAGLRGTFKAWLSDSAVSAEERLSHSTAPYVRTDGIQVAERWSDLVTPPLAQPVNVDEHGATLARDGDLFSTAYVWTGTLPDGRGVGPWNCDEWTSAGGRELKDNAIVGNANDATEWSTIHATSAEVMTLGCEYEFRLYCLQQ